MKIEFTSEETRALKTALDLHVLRLRDELVHTDDRAYRQALRSELDALEAIDRRISLVVAGNEASAA
jgi:hypothetical protein